MLSQNIFIFFIVFVYIIVIFKNNLDRMAILIKIKFQIVITINDILLFSINFLRFKNLVVLRF